VSSTGSIAESLAYSNTRIDTVIFLHQSVKLALSYRCRIKVYLVKTERSDIVEHDCCIGKGDSTDMAKMMFVLKRGDEKMFKVKWKRNY
jgi:hypothetical protein